MVAGQRIKLRWASYEEELIKKTEANAKLAKAQSRLIDLFRQGYTADEVEKLLAKEAAASQGTPQ